MKGFVLGLIVAALAFGAYVLYTRHMQPAAPVVAARPDAGPVVAKARKKRRARGAARIAKISDDSAPVVALDPDPEPVKLSAADLKSVPQGDDLSKADVIRMDLSQEGGPRELEQEDIDQVFRAREGDILECIGKARPDGETYVPGRVSVKFRIERKGTVRGVRVEAPAILQKGGLYGCVRGIVGGLKFPASASGQIATYPFALN